MDHFLFAKNPLKQTAPTGLQGYLIDTVKGTWTKLEIFNQSDGKPQKHLLTMIAGTGNNKEDGLSAHRLCRWYNSLLIARKVKTADIEVILPSYSGTEAKPQTRYDYQKKEGESMHDVQEGEPNSSKGTEGAAVISLSSFKNHHS